MKEKNREIQVLRGIAMSAVVLIHLFNLGLSNIKVGMDGYWFFQISHSLFQFAVPCFIFISAVILSYTNRDGRIDLKKFYMEKFKRLVVPYFMWTLFFLGVKFVFGLVPGTSISYQLNVFVKGQLSSLSNWWEWLAFGKAYAHLYFMSIVIQFAIVSPLMLKMVKWIIDKFEGKSFTAAVVLALVPQVAIYWINRLYIYSHFKYTATMLIWYWCILVLGIWVGFNYEKFVSMISRFKYVILSALAVSAAVYLWYRVAIVNGQSISTFYYQMVWYLYVIFATTASFMLSVKISKQGTGSKVLEWIGRYSFGIYLMHPVITLIMSRTIKTSDTYALTGIIAVAFPVIMFLCGGISKLLESNRYTSFLVGAYHTR